jgi:hypothetical protein
MEKSKALQFFELAWNYNNNNSWSSLNPALRDTIETSINLRLDFDTDDFIYIYSNYRGRYYFGVNANGKGMGERFYDLSCRTNHMPSILAYEKFAKIKPFILNNKRVYPGCRLRTNDRRYRVTGYDNDKNITIVSYVINDIGENGKRENHRYSNKEWKKCRSLFTFF